MKNLLKEFKHLSLWSMVLFISFVINSCDENNNSTKESVNKTGTSLIKADLTELTNKIGDRDLKLIELIKNNPVSMIKAASYQKTKTSSSEYYFDTDNIMALKNETNQAVYIIPAYKSSNARDSNIYSISINITDDFIDTKLNILQLKDDGTQESISYDFVYSSSTSKTSKVKDIECYCTVTISDCPCHPSNHSPSGCDHPVINAANCSCSGSSSSSGFGTTSGTTSGANTVISNIWASSGGGTNYGYAYNYTAQQVCINLQKKFTLKFTSFQQAAIVGNQNISEDLLSFLNIDGNTESNNKFALSIIDGIENATVNSYEEFSVLLNAYKQVQEFLAFKNNYFAEHPNTNMAQFENWFMRGSEGADGIYDAAFWDNPNLTFPTQSLPSWANFEASFPKDSNPLYNTPEKMYNSVGGTIATFYTGPNTNTCAIRLSKTLNYSGVIIPNIPGQTYSGADGKFYFKSAYQINLWMRKTFGTNPATTKTPYNANHYEYNSAQAGVHGINLPGLLNGKKGIYSIYSSDFKWATGHADLLNSDAICGNRCHFYDAPILRLDVWILN